eukprot:TRINITY_DN6224_c1_g1_i1.p1 TRINITY_DN6224_c1_g1~~TRINITY_DN6224_c1_g1_i1.p1  ORF type:complete len:254 (-),score=73.52 TRINITY_DN6224_c1_g1_i1:64-825(-)
MSYGTNNAAAAPAGTLPIPTDYGMPAVATDQSAPASAGVMPGQDYDFGQPAAFAPPPPETFSVQEPPGSEVDSASFTLDEPVWLTLWRDVRRIGVKLLHVLVPTGRKFDSSKDWDLWGPLIICLILAIVLSTSAPGGQVALVFAIVFVLVWLGGCIITINAALLGGSISFFQSICVMGYCVFPLAVAALALFFISMGVDWWWLRWVITVPAFAWSTWASVGFMGALVPTGRRTLSVYPIFLFYLVIAWMVIIQ